MRIAISKCLLGAPVRYDGGSVPSEAVRALAERVETLELCPEVLGGLPVPRKAAELCAGRALCEDGSDVTAAFERGVERALAAIDAAGGVSFAVLKEKSPSCGSSRIYDGSHTGRVVRGQGLFARCLSERGVCVVSELDVERYRPSAEHPVAIVLGSGLGGLGAQVEVERIIPYSEIEGFPADAHPVPGHSFEAKVGTIDGVPVVVYPGRVHLYQGYSDHEVTALVRHARSLGCKTIIIACATGAVAPKGKPGLAVVTDHINLTGANPLIGPAGKHGVESPFVDMGDAYTPYLRELAKGVAADLGIELDEAIYGSVVGPTYETPAETRMLSILGVTHAGMSLVNEAIMARALDMGILAVVMATNMSGASGVTHEEVLKDAAKHASDFERLVRGVLALM